MSKSFWLMSAGIVALGAAPAYAQDNTQPHHATADYKSESYFADKRRPPNVHSEMKAWHGTGSQGVESPSSTTL